MKTEKKNNLIRSFLRACSRVGTGYLIIVLVVFGWFCLGLAYEAGKLFPGNPAKDLLASLVFLIWGLAGLPMITREEVPPFGVSGTLAVIYGIAILILGLGISIALFYASFIKWFAH